MAENAQGLFCFTRERRSFEIPCEVMTIEESRPIGSYIGQLETFSPCPKSLAEFRPDSSYIRVDNTEGRVITLLQ